MPDTPSSPALPPLIGLIGPAGSGKTTVAEILKEHWDCVPIAFADPMLQMLGQLLECAGVGGEWMTERALKEHPMPVIGASFRRLAQTLGTDWGRELIARDLWVRIAMHRTDELRRVHGAAVVVSDVRFMNEAAAIRGAGGVLWRIDRPGAGALPQNGSRHVSETELHAINEDQVLDNSGSMAQLRDQVGWLMSTHLRKCAAAAARGL